MRQLEICYSNIDHSIIKPLFEKREKFSHKGDYGHGLLIAGSFGMGGSAVLAARAALRSGLGLLTVHIPNKLYDIIQISVPEAMCTIDVSNTIFSGIDWQELDMYKAVAVGPGLGKSPETALAVAKLIESCKYPMVIDADALNIIGAHSQLLDSIPENSILTPHPKEFGRLIGRYVIGQEAIRLQMELSIDKKIIIVLKGANTSVSTPDGKLWINTAGNPGMATAGSGDVLSGVILGLLTQGFDPVNAAIAGVYVHSVAGDIAASKKGETSLIASDIISYLGEAFMCVAL